MSIYIVRPAYYNKSDDLYTLASLQRKYERICVQIAETTNEDELSLLNAEKASLEAELNAQEEVVNGYDDAEEV
ncbi:MAG: hypothetical protein J6A61_02960 [Clostridia bacterium]|nr:hypothetical protein [Clostridia bacterium]